MTHMWYAHGMGPVGWTMMIAFWALVVFLVIWVTRSIGSSGSGRDQGALRILDERLARGEIEPAEYEERRRVLERR